MQVGILCMWRELCGCDQGLICVWLPFESLMIPVFGALSRFVWRFLMGILVGAVLLLLSMLWFFRYVVYDSGIKYRRSKLNG